MKPDDKVQKQLDVVVEAFEYAVFMDHENIRAHLDALYDQVHCIKQHLDPQVKGEFVAHMADILFNY